MDTPTARQTNRTPPPASAAPRCAAPPIVDLPLAEAEARAQAQRVPIFIPSKVHVDDRGWSLMNQMLGVLQPTGQINYSVMFPHVVKAWHRHQIQTDFWVCLGGHLKAGVFREDDGQAWQLVIGEKRPGVLIIPPTLWHGAMTVGPDPAGLLYYVTQAYNPQAPDEQRRAFDSVPGFTWEVDHR